MQEAAFGHAQHGKRYKPLEGLLSTAALPPDFPHTLPTALGTRGKGMRMGNPCEWSRDRVGHS